MKTLTNYLYNLTYQILTFVLPIITTPYVSRVLGADGIGQYTYVSTVATYFVVVGLLGLNEYGSREIARTNGNCEEQRAIFWEITTLRVGTLIVAVLAFCIYTLFFVQEFKLLYWIHLIFFASYLVDTTWMFQGNAQFKLIATKNCLVKLASVAMIFLFVRQKQDLWIYAAISCGALFAGNCFLLSEKGFRTLYRWKAPYIGKIFRHLKRTIFFFIPGMAGTFLNSFGKVVIGSIEGDVQLGLFQSADRIVRISLTIITALTAVMLPKLAAMNTNATMQDVKKMNDRVLAAVCMMTCPIAFGLVAVSNTLVPWFFGSGFAEVSTLIQLEAPALILIGLETTFGNVFLLASGQEKNVTFLSGTGTLLNIALNFVLVSMIGTRGAILALFVTELFFVLVGGWMARNAFSKVLLIKRLLLYMALAALMGVIVFKVGQWLPQTMGATILMIGIGGTVYLTELLLVREQNLLYLFAMLKQCIISRRNKDE